MRFIAFALLAVAATSAEARRKICEPGSYKKADCNSCVCSKDGTTWGCTLMLCADEDLTQVRTRRQAIEKVCEPDEVMHDGCNTCYCLGDGSGYVCTAKACFEPKPVIKSSPIEAEQVCEPGTQMQDGCNTCFCLGDGSGYVCTLEACPKTNPLLRPESSSERQTRGIEGNNEKECEPGKSYKKYCNTCFCGPNGKPAGCTKMGCPPGLFNEDGSFKRPNANNPLLREKRETNENCEPGKRFKSYCNSCACGPDGKKSDAACSRMACPPGMYNEDGTLRLPHSDNPLLREKRETNENCEPGKRFKSYCNSCACGPDGKKSNAACSRMACPPGMYNEDGTLRLPHSDNPLLREKRETNENCEPGKRFKSYCNSCACGPDGKKSNAACSRMACPPGMYNEDGTLRLPHSDNPLLREKRETNENCEPGKRFQHYCNTCACGPTGKKIDAPCTKMYCTPGMYNEDGSLRFPNAANPLLRGNHDEECEPGKRFQNYCNSCTCGPSGKKSDAACTKMYCPPGFFNEDGSRTALTLRSNNDKDNSAQKICEPGKSFKDECNTCVCNKDGTSAACTLVFCFPKALAIAGSSLGQKLPQVCEPGKSFFENCNRCVCSDDGASARCTLMNCATKDEGRQKRSVGIVEASNQFCSPGENFKQDCNNCVCGADGTSALCNLQFCASRSAKTERSAEKFCEPGKSYKQDCNTCVCNKEGTAAACTLKMCLPSFLTIAKNEQQVCQPGKSFKKDCNDCICNKSGTDAACTLKLCPPVLERTVRSEPQICQPGKSFKQSCNDCVCSKDGTRAVCTQMLCPTSLERTKRSSEQRVCQPGKSFKEDCNDCICNKFGTGAVCTLQLCPPELNREEETAASQICEPGAIFKSDCNTCICNESGTSAGCSMAYCVQRPVTTRRSVNKVCEPGKYFKKGCNSCICNKYGTDAACTLLICTDEDVRESLP